MNGQTLDDMIRHFTRGNATLGDWIILYKFSLNRKYIIELGTAHGFGALMLANGADVYTIDNHKLYRDVPGGLKISPRGKWLKIESFLDFVSKGKIRTIRDDTVDYAMHVPNERADLIYIDGGHSREQVSNDFKAWFPKLKVNGVFLFHDVNENCPGVLDFYKTCLFHDTRIRELVQEVDYETSMKVFVKVSK